MIVTTVLLLIVLKLTPVSCRETLRVYNGHETHDKYLVRIVLRTPSETIKCSGSILNQHWVISAAHCLESGAILDATIDVNYGRKPIEITKIILHPSYNPSNDGILSNVKHDISLLKTKEPIKFNKFVVPIRLDRKPPAKGHAASVAGYGLPDLKARKGNVTLSYCGDNDMLCSHSSAGFTRPGRGDSGGPLVYNGKLVGIDSTSLLLTITENGSGRQGKTYTEYYADIASNINWIESVINS